MNFYKYFINLKPYLVIYKIKIFVILLCVVTVSASLLLLGQSIKDFIHSISYSQDLTLIYQQFFYIIITIAIFSIASFFRSYNLNVMIENITAKIKIDIYKSLMKKDQAYFDSISTNEILDNISAGSKYIEQFLSNILSFLVRNFILFIASLLLMIHQNAKLFLIFIALLPITIIPPFILKKIIKKYNASFQEKNNNIFGFVEESITNFKIISSFNKSQQVVEQFQDLYKDALYFNNSRQKVRSLCFAFIVFSFLSLIAGVTLFGAIQVSLGFIPAAELVMFIFYALLLCTGFVGLLEPLMSLFTQNEEVTKFFALIDLSVSSNDFCYQEIFETNKDIVIKNLHFSYKNSIAALIDINLIINQGAFIAVTGPSGSGKSSLIKLILNFYPNGYQGDIYIKNLNIKSYVLEANKPCIAYVPQDPMLFSCSIIENIKFGASDITNQELNQIIDLMQLTDIVKTLGSSLLTNKSNQLSGGQKQLVAIARALAVKPDILICDEATSAMDFNLENIVLTNIIKYMKGKTIIYVAHRLASIKNADEILVMDAGKIIDSGSHENLMLSCGLYRKLYNLVDYSGIT